MNLYHRLPKVTTLGPGTRYVLWVQGCSRHCPGCLAPEAWATDGGESVSVAVLAQEISETRGLEGVTISGGEPFEQALELAALVASIRTGKGLGIIVYTGFTLEELNAGATPENGYGAFLAGIDLLIDGPYRPELDDGRSLRGSSNQRAIALTPRYRKEAVDLYGANGRHIEVFVQGDQLAYAGIPPASFRAQWRGAFRKEPARNLKGESAL